MMMMMMMMMFMIIIIIIIIIITIVMHPNTYIQMQKSVILGTCSIVRNFLNHN